jgi:hypothetical protein
MVSEDWGNSWSSEDIIAESISREQGMAIAEAGDGAIWLARTDFYPLHNPEWDTPVQVIYKIHKYVVGSGATVSGTILTDLINVYGGSPTYPLINPKALCSNCNIATEGSKIVLAYANDHTLIAKVGSNYWGTPRYYVMVSSNNGSTWGSPQEILFSDSLLASSNWRQTLPPICISNGNLFVYVVGGTYNAIKYYILKSADSGATWSIAYDIPVVTANYYWDAEIRANGDHITMCACGMSMDAGEKLGFAESLDGGTTWHIVSIEPLPTIQILAPA